MASGDDKAAEQAGHMAAPTSNAHAQLTLANGEPSTQGAKRRANQVLMFSPLARPRGRKTVLAVKGRADAGVRASAVEIEPSPGSCPAAAQLV
jgi:hypothetical protein